MRPLVNTGRHGLVTDAENTLSYRRRLWENGDEYHVAWPLWSAAT